MTEVTGTLEKTAGVEATTEEVRWRMEVVASHARGVDTLERAAKDFNKALAILNQGEVDEGKD